MFVLIAESLHGSFVLAWSRDDRLVWSDRLYDALVFHDKGRAERFGRNYLTVDWRLERVSVH